MNRTPIALCYVRRLNEWRACQTPAQARGHEYEAILFLRWDIAESAKATLLAGLTSPKIIVNEGHEALAEWGIPSPYPTGPAFTKTKLAGFPK
jgi:hypothetical protein